MQVPGAVRPSASNRRWWAIGGVVTVPLLVGAALIGKAPPWDELGATLVGGTVLSGVFVLVQFTLDQRAAARQEADEVARQVSSSPALSGIDLSGRDLARDFLRGKDLTGANLDRAGLAEADLKDCTLARATLREADLVGADLRGAALAHASLDRARLDASVMDGCDLTGTSLAGAYLVGASLRRAGHNGDPVDLSGAVLDRARLDDARLRGTMASFSSAFRAEAPAADLRGSDLSCADLRAANLRGASFRDADLGGADLAHAQLVRADLRGARLLGTRLVGADLTGARIDGAVLRGVDLRGAVLTGVTASAAEVAGCIGATPVGGGWQVAPMPDAGLLGAVALKAPGTRTPLRPSAGAEPRARTASGIDDPHGGPGDAEAPTPFGRLVIAPARTRDRLQAHAVAARLEARRQALAQANARVAAIGSLDAPPHLGEAADHGLPVGPVRTGRRHRSRRGPVVVVGTGERGSAAGTASVTLVPPGRRRRRSVAGGATTEVASGDVARLADAAQHLLAPTSFLDAQDHALAARWLDTGNPERAAADGEVRHPLALLVRSWRAYSTDLAQMERARDEAKAAWAATRSPTWRALAAARLAWAQAQVRHRSAAASDMAIACARAAGGAAVARLDLLAELRPPGREANVARAKALSALGLAQAVTGGTPGLEEATATFATVVRLASENGVDVDPAALNSMGYTEMELAGLHTRGSDHIRYTAAADAFLRVLQRAVGNGGEPRRRPPGPEGIGLPAPTELAALIDTLRRRHRGRPPRGADEIAERLTSDRSVRLSLVNLGNLYRLHGRHDQAVTCIEATIEDDPNYREAYTERAWVELDRHRPRDADAAVERMLRCAGGTPDQVATNLVKYARALGRAGLAGHRRPWLLEAKRHSPASGDVTTLLAEWEAQVMGTNDKDAAPEATNAAPAATWPAPRTRPDTYPGQAPGFPYLLLEGRAHPLVVRLTGDVLRVTMQDGTPLDTVLRDVGAPPLAERYPSLAYGANRSPDSLQLKFDHHASRLPPSPVVPVLTGALPDIDVVGAGFARQGFIYGDLVDSPGTQVEAMMALLDRRQLVAIHDSEDVGRAYDCCWLGGFRVPGAEATLDGLAYVGRRPIFHVPDDAPGDDAGHPLAYSAVATTGRRLPELTQVQMLARVIEVTEILPVLTDVLRLDTDATPEATAREVIRLVNGQWWYAHNTGDQRTTTAIEAENLLTDAMAKASIGRNPHSPLIASALRPEDAYAPSPERLLRHQVELPE